MVKILDAETDEVDCSHLISIHKVIPAIAFGYANRSGSCVLDAVLGVLGDCRSCCDLKAVSYRHQQAQTEGRAFDFKRRPLDTTLSEPLPLCVSQTTTKGSSAAHWRYYSSLDDQPDPRRGRSFEAAFVRQIDT